MGLRQAVECVKKHKSFLITAHTNLEGDALGSEIAFYILLKKLGKKAVIVNEDGLPYGYEFFPLKNEIKRYKQNMRGLQFDCFAVLDCSDLHRTGEVYRLNSEGKTVLNIDHHISNIIFGDVNWVEPEASSCSELIYKLYKKLRVPFDKNSACALYAGILTDTGSFRYSNTSSFTHKAVAELLKHGLNIVEIYKNIYEKVPFEDMKLLSEILPQMKREAGGKIVWFQIKAGMLKGMDLRFDLSEHVLTFGRCVEGVEAVALFKENLGDKHEIKVNLRSQGKVDVNKVASAFGGGGHKAAAGITTKGNIDQIRKQVLAKIKENLK